MIPDPRATRGFDSAEVYDLGRPSVPSAAVVDLAVALELTPASTVLDLGAGTGLFTQTLVPLVGRVIAVDPSESMLGAVRRRLPSVEARLGAAEAIPLADDSVAAVFVADAFHWFRTTDAAAEIARVLGPRGHLVLIWHHQRWWERREPPWIAEFEEGLEPFYAASVELAGEHPTVTKQWRTDLEGVDLFEALPTTEVEFVQLLSGEDFVSLVASWSWVAILPGEQRDAALSLVRELVGSDPELRLTYRTEIQRWRLR